MEKRLQRLRGNLRLQRCINLPSRLVHVLLRHHSEPELPDLAAGVISLGQLTREGTYGVVP